MAAVQNDAIAEAARMAVRAHVAGQGFGALGADGVLDASRPVTTLGTARTTFLLSVCHRLGLPGVVPFVEEGLAALGGPLSDSGGAFRSTAGAAADAPRSAYELCFVTLAAATATSFGIASAEPLLEGTLALLDQRYWSEADSALIHEWSPAPGGAEPYWGANENMHGVECMLAAYTATGETRWRDRARAVAANFIDRRARTHGWMLNEHYADDWTALRDFNRDDPGNRFRPYGVTPGHLFEWSRLLLELDTALVESERWTLEAATGLYSLARRLSWCADGAPGFLYTVDWQGVPAVTDRPHWVAAEAVSAASTLARVTGEDRYDDDSRMWSAFFAERFGDPVNGGWHNVLDRGGAVLIDPWPAKPDMYHVIQCSTIPDLPVAASLSARLSAR